MWKPVFNHKIEKIQYKIRKIFKQSRYTKSISEVSWAVSNFHSFPFETNNFITYVSSCVFMWSIKNDENVHDFKLNNISQLHFWKFSTNVGNYYYKKFDLHFQTNSMKKNNEYWRVPMEKYLNEPNKFAQKLHRQHLGILPLKYFYFDFPFWQ